RRRRFAESVRLQNRLMPTPCANCKRSNRRCLVDLESGRCSECISRNSKCDLVVTAKEFEKVRLEKDRLSEELLLAQDREIQARMRAIRIRRQLALLDSREQALLDREMA